MGIVGRVFCRNCGAVGTNMGLAVFFRPTGIDPRPHEWRDYEEYDEWKANTPRLPNTPAPGLAVALTAGGARLMALFAGIAVAATPVFAAWWLSQGLYVSAAGPILAFLAFAIFGGMAMQRVLPKLGFPKWQARLLWLPVIGGVALGRWAWRWATDPSATLT